MIGWFLGSAFEGVVAPRRSARRMLNLGIGLREAGLFIVLSYVLFAIFVILLPPQGWEGGGKTNHLIGVFTWGIVVLLIAWFAWLPPKFLGGVGEWGAVFPAIAWMTVLVVMLMPLGLLGLRAAPVLPIYRLLAEGDLEGAQNILASVPEGDLMTFSVLATVCSISCFWVFSGFVAELHGFSTWAVVAVVFALNFFLPMLF